MKLLSLIYFLFGSLLLSTAYVFANESLLIFILASVGGVCAYIASVLYGLPVYRHLISEVKSYRQVADNWQANANDWRDEYHSLRTSIYKYCKQLPEEQRKILSKHFE